MRAASALADAWATGHTVAPVTSWWSEMTLRDAYEVQRRLDGIAGGDCRRVGWKVGLTDVAGRAAFGARQPIYGWLSGAMDLKAAGGAVRLRDPRIEVELAARIGVAGEQGGDGSALSVTELRLAFEVIDSRYRGGPPTLVDLVADDSNAAGYALGEPVDLDRSTTTITVARGSAPPVTLPASVSQALASVSWLGETLAAHGHHLTPGDIVLSGSLGVPLSVDPGDRVHASDLDGGSLEVGIPGVPA